MKKFLFYLVQFTWALPQNLVGGIGFLALRKKYKHERFNNAFVTYVPHDNFGGVSLVGILNADNLLNNPDFRAAERAFQLMMQVAGRAGRRDDGGEVVIQTSEPGHPVIRQVAAGDFEGMARAQLAERKAFFYPPYARLTSLTLRHRDPSVLRNGVMDLAARLRTRFGRRLLGPMTPPVDRIRGEYLVGLLLKIESGASSARARELLAAELKTFAGNPAFKSITVVVNVDPQ